jgi:hypothetical protein
MQPYVCFFVLVLSSWSLVGAELFLDFEEAAVNKFPQGFRSTVTGSGPPGDWKVLLDDAPDVFRPEAPRSSTGRKRPVVAQLSQDQTDEHCPLLVYQGETFDDFKLTTRFKIVAGQTEQMAGIAFRIQNETNYYYIRASALGSNIAFFKWIGGQRFGPYANKVEIPTNRWHELTIECRGNEIRCLLNGQQVLPAFHDDAFASGRVAFWTKSDSVSYFADTHISYVRKEILAQRMVREALQKYPKVQGLKIYTTGTNTTEPKIVASGDPKEIGRPAGKVELDILARGLTYHLQEEDRVEVTMPLRDFNGEIAGVARVVMKHLPGQTEKTAITRAVPIIRFLESQFQRAADLVQ